MIISYICEIYNILSLDSFIHYQLIQETKYKSCGEGPPKLKIIFHVSQYIKFLIKDS